MIIDTLQGTGVIVVGSIPDGAEVYLDGDSFGHTPKYITDVAPGPHTLEVKKEGFITRAESVFVNAGLPLQINALMATEPLSLPNNSLETKSLSPKLNSLQNSTCTLSEAIVFVFIGAGLVALGMVLSNLLKK